MVHEVDLLLEVVVVLGICVVDVNDDFFVVLDETAPLSPTMGFSALSEKRFFASVAFSDIVGRSSLSDPAVIAACLSSCFAPKISGPEFEASVTGWSLGSALGIFVSELFVSLGWTAGVLSSDSGFRTAFDTRPFSSVRFADRTGSSMTGIVSLAPGCRVGWARSPERTMPPLLRETCF